MAKDVLRVQFHVHNIKEHHQLVKVSQETISNAGVKLLQLLITVGIEYVQITLQLLLMMNVINS